MNKYEEYKKVLDNRIDEIMMNKFIDINSLDELSKLLKMSTKIESCINGSSKEKVEDKTETNIKNYEIVKHLNKYFEHKHNYKNTSDIKEKEEMLNCLNKTMDYLFNSFKEIGKNFDCQEEKNIVNNFLRTTFSIIN